MTKEIFEQYLCQIIVPYCEQHVPGGLKKIDFVHLGRDGKLDYPAVKERAKRGCQAQAKRKTNKKQKLEQPLVFGACKLWPRCSSVNLHV